MSKFVAYSLISGMVITALFASSADAQKKIYKWTDAKGVVHYSERQPASESAQGNEQLNAQGVVVNKQADQQTAIKNAEETKRLEAERKAVLAQKEADQRLIDSYASEADITRGYQQNVQLLEQQVNTTTIDIADREKGLAKLVAQAAETERAGKPVPEAIKQMIANERVQILTQKKYVVDKNAAKLTAKTKYEQDLKRYREVLARNKK
jgi:hypothetical protein